MTHHSLHTTHFTPHHLSYRAHLTPLISQHSSYATSLSPVISQHSNMRYSSYTTQLIPNAYSGERHKTSHVGLSGPFNFKSFFSGPYRRLADAGSFLQNSVGPACFHTCLSAEGLSLIRFSNRRIQFHFKIQSAFLTPNLWLQSSPCVRCTRHEETSSETAETSFSSREEATSFKEASQGTGTSTQVDIMSMSMYFDLLYSILYNIYHFIPYSFDIIPQRFHRSLLDIEQRPIWLTSRRFMTSASISLRIRTCVKECADCNPLNSNDCSYCNTDQII